MLHAGSDIDAISFRANTHSTDISCASLTATPFIQILFELKHG